ncbi:MAG TPA: response regulator transcription factor [Polyangiales bacterium]|nr:response regulator transcription factor [Polyangiales bacterium]
MRILVADDDAKFLEFATETLSRRGGHEVSVVSDGVQALERAIAEQPDVLILDWLMPRLNGTQVCRLLRARAINAELYVVFVTGRGRREELIECLNAGADDLLVKPVAPDVLVARIELARQRSPSAEANVERMRRALGVAAQQRDGEFVVRSGNQSARVFFHDGRVAWAHLADGSGTFLQELAVELELGSDMVEGILADCRRKGAKFTDVVVAWGVLDRNALRERLRTWMAKKLQAIIHLPQARSLFLPQRHESSGEMSFSLEELDVSPTPVDVQEHGSEPFHSIAPPSATFSNAFVFAPEPSPAIEAILDRCMALEGVLGVVAIERTSGYCLGSRGIELNADAAWAHVRCLNTVMRIGNVQDSIVTTDDHFHLARLLPAHSETFLYAVVDARSGQLAMARLKLQQAAEH